MTDDTQNLTGVWHGLYTYPAGTSVSFVATLIEAGGHLSGSTHEPCVAAICLSDTVYATLSGSWQGNAVTFIKTYDNAGPDYQNPVAYEGTLSGDATEIEGRWTIRGLLSGKFLMIRSAGKAEEVERKVHEKV